MTPHDARDLARSLMDVHGLSRWVFRFDRAKRRFGSCRFDPYSDNGAITLSLPLTLLNDEAAVRDTILHEIAHALAGRGQKPHGSVWRTKARQVGCEPTACYPHAEVVTPAPRWVGRCGSCGYTIHRHIRKRIACGRCCKRHSGGHFDPRFLIRFEPNREGATR